MQIVTTLSILVWQVLWQLYKCFENASTHTIFILLVSHIFVVSVSNFVNLPSVLVTNALRNGRVLSYTLLLATRIVLPKIFPDFARVYLVMGLEVGRAWGVGT